MKILPMRMLLESVVAQYKSVMEVLILLLKHKVRSFPGMNCPLVGGATDRDCAAIVNNPKVLIAGRANG